MWMEVPQRNTQLETHRRSGRGCLAEGTTASERWPGFGDGETITFERIPGRRELGFLFSRVGDVSGTTGTPPLENFDFAGQTGMVFRSQGRFFLLFFAPRVVFFRFFAIF